MTRLGCPVLALDAHHPSSRTSLPVRRIPGEYMAGCKKYVGDDLATTPLIAFINGKSGGHMGPKLLTVLSRSLGQSQVVRSRLSLFFFIIMFFEEWGVGEGRGGGAVWTRICWSRGGYDEGWPARCTRHARAWLLAGCSREREMLWYGTLGGHARTDRGPCVAHSTAVPKTPAMQTPSQCPPVTPFHSIPFVPAV